MKKIIVFVVAMLLMVGCSSQKDADNKTPVTQDKTVSFTAVGDNLMHQLLIDNAKKGDDYDFSSYYQNIQSYIQKADLAFVNQETILGGGKPSGYPNFNTILFYNCNIISFFL